MREWFKTEHLAQDLVRRSIRGGAVTVTAQALKFVLQTGSIMILARLLTPADFGLIAMVAAFTGFVSLFKDLGLSMATVQRAQISHTQVSTLFWTNVALSVVLMMLTVAMAPAVAWFYGEPRLTWITTIIAGTFLLEGLSAQHTALLRRQMRFTALATIQLLSLAVGIIVGILLAWYGAGYWALVAVTAITALANTLLVWSFAPWGPGRPSLGKEVREMIGFGGNLTAFGCVNYFTRNMDNVLIGAVWGAAPLGIYSRAYSLLLLPLNQVNAPIGAVAIPALSRLQDNPERYRSFYRRMIQLIAYVTMPFVVLLAILSDEIVLIVLGDQWLEAAVIFRIFAFFALTQSVVVTIGWVLVSLGQTRRLLKLGVFASICTVASFVIGLPWGPVGVALAATICLSALVIPVMIYAFQETPISLADIGAATWRPLTLSILLGLVGGTAYQLTTSLHFGARIVIVVFATLTTASCTLALWRSIREDARWILSLAHR